MICCICLQAVDLTSNDVKHSPAALRSCGHVFGWHCVQQWASGTNRRCPQCNAACVAADVLRLYAQVALNASAVANNDAAMQRQAMEQRLEQQLQTSMKESAALRRQNRLLTAQLAQLASLQSERDAALRNQEQLTLESAALRVELQQLRVRLQHAGGADAAAALPAAKRPRSATDDAEAAADSVERSTAAAAVVPATAAGTLGAPKTLCMARAVRVRVGCDLGGLVVVACGNDRGRFDFVKLDGLQLQYGSTLSSVHQHRVRDMRLYAPLPSGPFAEPMILSAAGRVLQLTSLRSNNVALSVNLAGHGWSCVAMPGLGVPTALACGSESGSVVVYDVRRPAAPLLTLPPAGAGRGQPLFGLDCVCDANGGKWLVGTSAGRLSSWQLDTEHMSLVRSFAPVAWSEREKCRSGAVSSSSSSSSSLLTTHQLSLSIVGARFQHRLLQGFVPDVWPPPCEALFESACGVAALSEAGDTLVVCSDAVDSKSNGDSFSLLRLERGRAVARTDLPAAPLVVSGSNVIDMHIDDRWIAGISTAGLCVWIS